MLRRILYICLTLSLVIFPMTSFASEDSISPFGKLEWSDAFSEIIMKLNGIKGLDNINVVMGKKSISLQVSDQAEIIERMSMLLEKQYPELKSLESPKSEEFMALIKKIHYEDGKKSYFLSSFLIRVVASPIMIIGVPFEMVIKFKYTPGVAVTKREKLLTENHGFSFPVVMSEVYLVSKHPLLKTKYREIDSVIENKYKNFTDLDIKLDWSKGGGLILDKKGASLRAISGSTYYQIIYSNKAFYNEMEESYRKHLVDMKDAEGAKKPDMSSDL